MLANCLIFVAFVALPSVLCLPQGIFDLNWIQYKKSFGKTYADAADEHRHYQAFAVTSARIKAHNAKPHQTFVMALNALADKTPDELRKINGRKPPIASSGTSGTRKKRDVCTGGPKCSTTHTVGSETIPASQDWQAIGGWVTAVEDQGDCGSCYSFTAADAISAQFRRITGALPSVISKQQTVDCSSVGVTGAIACCNNGETCNNWKCDGGMVENVYWLHGCTQQPKVFFASNYAYTSGTAPTAPTTCQYQVISPIAPYLSKNVTCFTKIPQTETALKHAVYTKGPVVTAITVNDDDFWYYGSGIYTPTLACSQDYNDLNHYLLVVGYGTEGGVDYWKVKNSWGTSWGTSGYGKIKRGDNVCGIAVDASYPTLA